jgi:WhiB family transcriptional regulator, redox-sensing transcriptional regulator
VSVETFVRLAQRQPWMTQALCKGSGTSFFPNETRPARVNPKEYAAAVEVCQTCPVINECREYGKDEKFGVWGGTTPADRSPRAQRPMSWGCGTWQGYSKHRRAGTEACGPCLQAYSVYRFELEAQKRSAS